MRQNFNLWVKPLEKLAEIEYYDLIFIVYKVY
jgi:hypothetical protein